MRTRTRLLLAFGGLHAVLSVGAGITGWWWLDRTQQDQARESAMAVGRVLAAGGFSPTEAIRERMATLTGYRFELVPLGTPDAVGAVAVPAGEQLVRIRYRTPELRRAQDRLLLATVVAVAAGLGIYGALAFIIARRLARPLERLAQAARGIGADDEAPPVPAVGGGEAGLLAMELEQMRQRLLQQQERIRQGERLAVLGTFTATIAHEVRNPLSAMRLTLQLLARRQDEPALARLLDEIELLDGAIEELLAFSRGGSPVVTAPCDLAALVADAIRLLERQAAHAGVTIIASGSASVLADARRLRQCLLNLILNAIQAQSGGGSIEIRIAADGFTVADRGPGVDPAQVPRLFSAFASQRPGGTGLGLHLASQVAEAHGARLSYAPRPEGGSLFILAGLAGA